MNRSIQTQVPLRNDIHLNAIVKIERSDGRIHEAKIVIINSIDGWISCEWVEDGQLKTKDIHFVDLLKLNPQLFYVNINQTASSSYSYAIEDEEPRPKRIRFNETTLNEFHEQNDEFDISDININTNSNDHININNNHLAVAAHNNNDVAIDVDMADNVNEQREWDPALYEMSEVWQMYNGGRGNVRFVENLENMEFDTGMLAIDPNNVNNFQQQTEPQANAMEFESDFDSSLASDSASGASSTLSLSSAFGSGSPSSLSTQSGFSSDSNASLSPASYADSCTSLGNNSDGDLINDDIFSINSEEIENY